MMLNDYQLIIFDWDGTLMDSVSRIVSSMQGAAASLSIQIPDGEDVKQIIGLSLPEAINRLFPKCSDIELAAMVKAYKHHYMNIDTTPTPLFSGALNLLRALNNEKKSLAVATGKARAGLQRVWALSKTEHFFTSSRCADECLSKPHPDMIESLLLENTIAPNKALMIGDTSYDLEMAKRAGVDSIGVTYGVHQKNVLSAYEPKIIVDSVAQLHQRLFNVN